MTHWPQHDHISHTTKMGIALSSCTLLPLQPPQRVIVLTWLTQTPIWTQSKCQMCPRLVSVWGMFPWLKGQCRLEMPRVGVCRPPQVSCKSWTFHYLTGQKNLVGWGEGSDGRGTNSGGSCFTRLSPLLSPAGQNVISHLEETPGCARREALLVCNWKHLVLL
jgi:hypothetical protein